MIHLLSVCASLQAGSSNHKLLQLAAASVPVGVQMTEFDGLARLPHFNPDLDVDPAPDAVVQWRRALATSDAVLIACPEYGHSLPGVLKNAVDWVIGSGELERKVVAITASVPHPDRGRRGLGALGDTLNAVSAVIVGGEPIARGAAFEAEVKALVEALVAEAERHRSLQGPL